MSKLDKIILDATTTAAEIPENRWAGNRHLRNEANAKKQIKDLILELIAGTPDDMLTHKGEAYLREKVAEL